MRDGRRWKRWLGGAVLVLTLPAAGLLASTPRVRGPAGRVARAVWNDLLPDRSLDVRLEVATTEGVRRGAAALLVGPAGTARPVAHVVAVEPGAVALRFEPGEDRRGRWRLEVLPPSRTFGEALTLAVEPSAAEALRADLLARARAAWADVLAPEAERRWPAFLRRIDPDAEPRTRRVLDAAGAEVLERLRPLWEGLSDRVTDAIDRKFDWLDRMGLLWKFVRGDGRGLKRELLPVAEEAARTWWSEHRSDVLEAVVGGVSAHRADVEAWLTDTVLAAAEEEVLDPVLAAGRDRLEADLRGWLRRVAEEVALDPAGGFRPRFAALLRQQLLDDEGALLLLERAP